MMWKVLMATESRASFENAAGSLVRDGKLQIAWADSTKAVIQAVRRQRPDLLIVDALIEGREGLELCREVMRTDAFVNMAAVSDLDEVDFHEASEGLGLIGRLPSKPLAAHFEHLTEILETIGQPIAAPNR